MEKVIRGIGYAALVGFIVLVLYGCNFSDWSKEQAAKADAAARAEATPHVIREADGCKVYAFRRDSRDHYFTRCGSTVTTESTYSVSCGKSCSSTKTESIVTEGNR